MKMADIKTLVDDLYSVLEGRGGWTGARGSAMGSTISLLANKRFSNPQEPRRYLSLSSVGSDCKRKLWYRINSDDNQETPKGADLLKFFYGDMIEELVISLVIASGHEVRGLQDRLDCFGIKGHRDCVIDGMTVDVKSASPFAFQKFKEGKLEYDDPFGYRSQLSSYVAAAKDDPLVTDKTHGAFLVVNKVNGEIVLDVHDMTEMIDNKPKEIQEAKDMVAGPMPTTRLDPVPQYKDSPNTKLCMSCSFCSHKEECWPEARTFQYSKGPVTLIDVVSLPRVPEVL
jgi:hypothetical protein